MNLPNYTITNLIVDYLIKIEIAVQNIKSVKLPAEQASELHSELISNDIFNLGELLGYPITLDQAQKVSDGQVLPSQRSKLKVFTNYRSTTEFIRNYSTDSFVPPSNELLVHINQLLFDRLEESWELGKFRAFSEVPNEHFDTWYKFRSIYPNIVLEDYFHELFRWVNNRKDKTHLLLKILIYIHESIDKSPLKSGNQLTTLACAGLIMKEFGYNPDYSISLTKTINYLDKDFINAMKLHKQSNDLTPFLEAVLYSLSIEAMRVSNLYETTFEQKVKKHGKLAHKFNKRQLKMIDYLENVNKISRKEYRKIHGISFMTAYRDLQQLVDEGYLDVKGSGRSTYYVLKEERKLSEQFKPEVKTVFGA